MLLPGRVRLDLSGLGTREWTSVTEEHFATPAPALGIDLDGTIDEAPDFFRFLAGAWPGPVYVVIYRDNQAKAEADVTCFGARAEVVLVNSFAEKADVIKRLGITVYFDDMDEVLLHVPEGVVVFKVRNGGKFCFDSKKW